MQIGDFKRFKNGVTVLYKHCNIYERNQEKRYTNT